MKEYIHISDFLRGALEGIGLTLAFLGLYIKSKWAKGEDTEVID